MSRHNLKGTNKAMSQPAALCRIKVQAELNDEIKFCCDKEFFCHDTTEEVCEGDCHDTLDFVATLIKENGSGNLS